MCRYVEGNALRAQLVARAEKWRWSSLWHRDQGTAAGLLDEWPIDRPDGWSAAVNRAVSQAELSALRHSVVRGLPFGATAWQERTAKRLGLETTLRPRGRPRKAKTAT